MSDYLMPIGLVAAFIAILIFVGIMMAQERTAFMDECKQHRPTYECTAMWRAGDPVVVSR